MRHTGNAASLSAPLLAPLSFFLSLSPSLFLIFRVFIFLFISFLSISLSSSFSLCRERNWAELPWEQLQAQARSEPTSHFAALL